MTWLELSNKIQKMNPEQQETDVTIALLDSAEVIGVIDFVDNWNVSEEEKEELGIDFVEDVLDNGHPFLTSSF